MSGSNGREKVKTISQSGLNRLDRINYNTKKLKLSMIKFDTCTKTHIETNEMVQIPSNYFKVRFTPHEAFCYAYSVIINLIT